uniref:Uncharacterized protein n=1 Tax=Xenopsylla cheopis TaxID=163159 RepID=A0A6M2DQH2_XENCH
MGDNKDILEVEDDNKFIRTIEGIVKLLESDEGRELASNITTKLKDLMDKFFTLDDDGKKEIKDRIKMQLKEKFKDVESDLVAHIKMSVYQRYALFLICLVLIVGLLAFFANKLYKSLTYKDRMREEKRKLKEERKNKEKKKVK